MGKRKFLTTILSFVTAVTLGTGCIPVSASSAGDVFDIAQSAMSSLVTISPTEEQYVDGQAVETTGIIAGDNEDQLLIIADCGAFDDDSGVMVTFADGMSYEGSVKSTDDDTGLSIVSIYYKKISVETLEDITVASLESAENLQPDDKVIAVGNSLDYGQSVSTGKVKSINNNISNDNNTALIETDITSDSDSKSTALLNTDGEFVGIISPKFGPGVAVGISQLEL